MVCFFIFRNKILSRASNTVAKPKPSKVTASLPPLIVRTESPEDYYIVDRPDTPGISSQVSREQLLKFDEVLNGGRVVVVKQEESEVLIYDGVDVEVRSLNDFFKETSYNTVEPDIPTVTPFLSTITTTTTTTTTSTATESVPGAEHLMPTDKRISEELIVYIKPQEDSIPLAALAPLQVWNTEMKFFVFFLVHCYRLHYNYNG